MTQYNTLNVKLSNSQLNKLKSAIKKGIEVILNLSSNLITNSIDETNFPHELLLPDTQISKIRKAFANDSSANIKFSKTQLSKMIQSGEILSELLVAIPQTMFLAGQEAFKKDISLAPKLAPKLAGKAKNIILIKE